MPHLTPPATIFAWAATRFPGTAAAALFALDAQLAEIARTTREPIVGQMRLTWWHDALLALDAAPPPANPVLRDLAATVIPHVSGADLATMIDAWEIVIDPDIPDAVALARYAAARGATLFVALARSVGAMPETALAAAGEGWALADLSAGVGDAAIRAAAVALAKARLRAALSMRWPPPLRTLGALALDARHAIEGRGQAGTPRRALAVLRFRLTGR